MGYTIDQLKKASNIAGPDVIPLQQNGLTKQISKSILDQGTIVTETGNSGLIRKEETFILQNNDGQINFTLGNAVGSKLQGNEWVDDAESAAGWISRIVNNSNHKHIVIVGNNSWDIKPNEVAHFLWTGSYWTLHHAHFSDLIVDGSASVGGNMSVGGALNVNGENIDTTINNAVGSKQDKYRGILGSSHTFDDNGVFLVQLNCSYANSQFYEVGIFVSSFDGQFPHYQRLFISPLVTDSFSIIQNGETLLVNPYWGSEAQRNNSYWQVFKISNCYY